MTEAEHEAIAVAFYRRLKAAEDRAEVAEVLVAKYKAEAEKPQNAARIDEIDRLTAALGEAIAGSGCNFGCRRPGGCWTCTLYKRLCARADKLKASVEDDRA